MRKVFRAFALLWALLCGLAETAHAQTPAIIYVDSAVAVSGTGASWTSPLKTLSEGLWKAHTITGAVQVWVRKGTYFPMLSPTVVATSRDSSFVIRRNNLKVYGGFAGTETSVTARVAGANNTILSGDIGVPGVGTDNVLHVIKLITYPVLSIDTSTVLDGLTITAGRADGLLPDIDFIIGGKSYGISSRNGGGLYLFCNGAGYSCTPLINNCRFLNNNAVVSGAVQNDGVNAVLRPAYTNCIFERNVVDDAGGAIGISQADVTIRNCKFRNNTGFSAGGAVFSSMENNTELRIERSVFDNNVADMGGALYMDGISTTLVARDNVFTENRANGSGGALYIDFHSGSDTLVNNVFALNSAAFSGGAVTLLDWGTSFMVGNTFYTNNAYYQGGALLVATLSEAQLYNNVFYGNYGNSRTIISDTSIVSYSSFSAGNNTFSNMPPHFINESDPIGPDGIWGTGDDGLQLSPCSPYINTGDNGKNHLSKDIAGNNRVYGGIIDPGAYELQQAALRTSDTLKAVICKGDSLGFDGVYYKTAQTHTDSFFTAGGCDSFRTLVLTVQTQAAPVVHSPVNYCEGMMPVALSAVSASATDTLLWYAAATGGAGNKTAPVPVISAGTTIYYVSSKSALGCESPRVPVTVIVVSPPDVPTAVSPVTYCLGAAALPLEATAARASDTLLWFSSSGGGTGSLTPIVPATDVIGSTSYYVASNAGPGCLSDRVMISVEIVPGGLPLVSLSPADVLLCSGNHIMLYCAPADTRFQYTWYKDGVDMGLPGTTTASPVGMEGHYEVRVNDSIGCADHTNGVNVSFYPLVVKPHITRAGSAMRLDHTYSSYQWYRNGRVIVGATGISYTLRFDGAYYAAVFDGNGCTTNSDTVVFNSLDIAETQAAGAAVQLYPNPTQSIVFIDAPVPVNITVKDITGRLVAQLQHAQQVDMTAYADGVYLFVVTDEEDRVIAVEKVHKRF